MESVNEGTTAYLSATFLNKAGVAEEPNTVHYRVDNLDGTEIRDTTEVTAAETVEVVLEPSDNRIINADGNYETRKVTFFATYADNEQVTGQYKYKVVPLGGVSGNPPAIG